MSCEGTQLRHPSHSRFYLCNEFTKRPHTTTYPSIQCILCILISFSTCDIDTYWHRNVEVTAILEGSSWTVCHLMSAWDPVHPSTVWEKMTQFMMINGLSACSGKEHLELEIVDMNLLCTYLWRPMTCYIICLSCPFYYSIWLSCSVLESRHGFCHALSFG